jgi:subtilisin family serine protease
MKRFFLLFLLAIFSIIIVAQDNKPFDPITQDLYHEMQQAMDNDLLRINIRLKDQYDAEQIINNRQSFTREELRTYVVSELKAFSAQSQQDILDELNYYSSSGQVQNIRTYWIANILNLYATPAVIHQLANRPDVERIDIDEERILIEPITGDDFKSGSKEITYNVLKVNAPNVWALGFTGEEIVVAVLDTGVNYNHNDLNGNMWTHPEFPFHGWSFVDNNNNPMDVHGHGTHCAGTVAGNGASGSETGVAPGAAIMALKVLDNSGGGTEAGVWAAIEFSVEYGAHIMSLSLGWRHIWNPDRSTWRTTMNNALAAGVVASVAAGNEGSGSAPSNVRTPGDVPPPWLHPDQTLLGGISAVVSVGATDINDNMASFSSRGPVTWQAIPPFNDYPYNPGMGLIRPDISAPGVDVKSLSASNPSGYTTMSGTSMATPCAAGVMALMLSKNPNLLPEDICQILEETAVMIGGATSKNNNSGSGRIDALEAINATSFPGPVYAYHEINDIAGNNDGLINPSELIQLSVALQNTSDDIYNNINATLTTSSPYITITNDAQFYGTFNPGDTILIENGFSFQVADNIPGGHEIHFAIETSDGIEAWPSEFMDVATAPNLTSGNIIVHDPNGNNNGNLDPGEEATLMIPTLNIGQLDSEPATVTLSTDSEYVTILTGTAQLGIITAGGSVMAEFPVTVSEDAPIGQNFTLLYIIEAGTYTIEKYYYPKIGIIFDNFETGDFSAHDWAFGGNLPWTITDSNPYEGQYSAKSGAITHNQSSQMIMDYDVGINDSISFYRRVSSEGNNDLLKFYINNVMVGEWSGNIPWGRVAFPVTPGFKTFKWEYVKNASTSIGEDCAWVDYIIFPALASCPGPRNLTASSVTANTAIISWTPGGLETEWDIVYGTAGFDPNSAGTLIENITSVPYTLTGLTGVSVYDFYIRSYCEDDEISGWSGPTTFTTLCDIFELPYLEPFGTVALDCWSFPEGQGNWAFGTSYTPPSSISGAPNAFFSWSPTQTNYSYSFTSPLMDGTNMADIKLDFILFINNYSGSTVENMAVEYKALDATEWTLLELFTTAGLGSGNAEHIRTNQELDGMDGNLFQIRFRAHGPNSWNINGWGLDDIHVHGEFMPDLPGDANCDSEVNVLDAITTVNSIMGNNPEPFCWDNADVTEDGIINVLDIIATVNIIMSGSKTSPFEIHSSAVHIFMNRDGIILESDGTLAGLQFEITGLSPADLKFELSGFEFVSTEKDGKILGLIFSFNNTPVPAGIINLFSFNNLNVEPDWGAVVAGNLNAEEVPVFKHIEGKDLFFEGDFEVSAYPNPAQGRFVVETKLPFAGEANIQIKDVTGRMAASLHQGLLSAGVHTFSLNQNARLSPGIYFLKVDLKPVAQSGEAVSRNVRLIITD